MKLIILDRDGVINFDSPFFIKSPEEWVPIPRSLQAIKMLNDHNWTVAVATNQSGIGRKLFSEKTLANIHNKMNIMLADLGAHVDHIAWCPHLPSDLCNCRKPKTGLYEQISTYFGVPLKNVPVVGDSLRDLQAANRVEATPILVKTGKGLKYVNNENLPPKTLIFQDLFCFVTSNEFNISQQKHEF